MKKFVSAICAMLIMAIPWTFGVSRTLATVGSLSISPTTYTDISQAITKAICIAPMPYTFSGTVYVYDNNNNNVFGSGLFDSCMSLNINYNGMQIGGTQGFAIASNDASYDGTWTMVLEQDNSQSFPTLSDALSSPKYLMQNTFTFNY